MRERGSTETCSSTPNTIRHMRCIVMIIHTAVTPESTPMTRRYGPGCAAELRPRRPLHRVVHEIANHPPQLNFYQFSQPHIHNNFPNFIPENTRKQKKTQMALPKYPTEQFPSSPFLICGGPTLFASTYAPLQVCLLHHSIRDERLLQKAPRP